MHYCPRAWPTIAEMRGKIMFVTDPDNLIAYKVAYPNLKGALMFLGDGAPHYLKLKLEGISLTTVCAIRVYPTSPPDFPDPRATSVRLSPFLSVPLSSSVS